MRPRTLTVLLLLGTLALFGCQQQQIVIPTVAQLPTITQTFTPTYTLTPSTTPSPTFTMTVTPSPTTSATPTSTFTATVTRTPTPTNTPVFTSTPLPTATASGPVINSFTADNFQVRAGGVTVLRWQAIGDSAVLDQFNAQGSLTQQWAVAPIGEQAIQVPLGQGMAMTYRLTVIRGGVPLSQSLTITVTCGFDWFFGNQFAPNDCPANVGAIGDGLFQEFDGGLMIYTPTASEGFQGNVIYVLFYAGNQWQAYPNSGAAPATGTPPGGRYLPSDPRFSNVWETGVFNGQPVKNTLQYATTANATAEFRTYQVMASRNGIYIDAPGSRIYRLQGQTAGTWNQVK